ncbi:MAG: hypothetical protein JO061_09720 [Acidobacteriaceae bacterium]|nr:hypothetical protein [Acidobacteriaceae bacterium]
MLNLKIAAAVLAGGALILSTGCTPQPVHPNQINTFDGASYDSLTLAHAALSSLRPTVAASYPQYTTTFNQAAAAYSMALSAYSMFRSAPTANQAAAAVAISNLTVSIVNLEDTFRADMHVQQDAVRNTRAKALRIRAAVAQRITVSDILAELQIAASIAATVPGTQPYSTIAEFVITATRSAIVAFTAAAGQPIDLSTIQPIAPIV